MKERKVVYAYFNKDDGIYDYGKFKRFGSYTTERGRKGIMRSLNSVSVTAYFIRIEKSKYDWIVCEEWNYKDIIK